ncbi:MAG: glycoside hydrolase family 18 protein [Armatimonadetes bacterium]|nr:glycoside hydrolase family 18 protein [Armatimonadota bacterium]
MKRSLLGLLAFSFTVWAQMPVLSQVSFPPKPPATKPGFHIVAYLPDYRAAVDPVLTAYVTDLIFFSVGPTRDGGIDAAHLTPAMKAKLWDIKRRYHLRLRVALGGADRSGGFGPMALDPIKRARFVRALTQFCLRNKFDGADYDWEFPANKGEDDAFMALLVETKHAFVPHKLLLSMAMAPWQDITPAASAAVDQFNLMTYFDDAHRAGLAHAQADTQGLLQKGVPPQKVCMGIPFYAEGIADASVTPAYADVVRQYHPTPDEDEVSGLAFNGRKTVQAKTRYALSQHLGGVMVWEIGQDTTDETSLMRAIRHVAAEQTH